MTTAAAGSSFLAPESGRSGGAISGQKNTATAATARATAAISAGRDKAGQFARRLEGQAQAVAVIHRRHDPRHAVDMAADDMAAQLVPHAQRAFQVQALADLHHRAHESCYLANSVRGEVRVEG